MAETKSTPSQIEERIEEAADTLCRLPERRMQRIRSSWPMIIRNLSDCPDMEPPRLRRGPPPAAAIDRMDEALSWLATVEPEEARLLWWRATRTPWKIIERRLGVSRQTAWRKWTYALIKIASLINGKSNQNLKNVATKKCVTKPGEQGMVSV